MPHDQDGNFVWNTSPICQEFIENNKKSFKGKSTDAWKTKPQDFKDLFSYYVYQIVQIIDKNGFKPAGWEEPWTTVINGYNKVVREKTEFLPEPKPIYAFNWNLDLASHQKDWSYQLPNG